MVQNITSEIYQVGGGGLTSPQDAAVYLVNFGNRAALVDAGCGWAHDKLIKNIRECNVEMENIEWLLITHCHFDHIGGISQIKEDTGCRVAAHELDAYYLEMGDDMVTAAGWYGASIDPIKIDMKFAESESKLDLGGREIAAIHIPGHSPGSVVYLTESDGFRVLFGQDVHGPLDDSLLSNRSDYIKSLQIMHSLEADILCEGHFGIYKGKDEVADFIQSFL